MQPRYPVPTKAVHIDGTVVIDSGIDAQGNVTKMKLISGSPLLVSHFTLSS
jgi:hypothetical protein